MSSRLCNKPDLFLKKLNQTRQGASDNEDSPGPAWEKWAGDLLLQQLLDCPSHRDSPLQSLASWVQACLVLTLGRAEEMLEGIPCIPEELCISSPGNNLFSPWEGRAGEKLEAGTPSIPRNRMYLHPVRTS